MKRVIFTALTALLMLSAAGCESWEPDAGYEYPVFSPDGASIAAVYMTYESKDKVTHTARRNFQSQVIVRNSLTPGAFQTLTPLETGHVVDLFYMKEAGYIIIGRRGAETEHEDGTRTASVSYDMVSLTGAITSLGQVDGTTMLSCDGGTSWSSTSWPLRVIPSPDGAVLARFEAITSCGARSQTLTLLDAADQSVLAGPFTLPEPNMAMLSGGYWPTAEIGWMEDDRFALAYWGDFSEPDMLSATLYDLDGTIESAVSTHHGCFFPQTSSSDVRADGSRVDIMTDTGVFSIAPPSAGISAPNIFGCP